MGRFFSNLLPRSVAQLAGMLVAAIVAFGTDLDVTYSIPLGIFAGAVAMFFVAVSELDAEFRSKWDERPDLRP